MTDFALDGVIRGDELYRWDTFCRKLNLGGRIQRRLAKDGLKVISYGGKRYVLGHDILDFFAKLSRSQANPDGEEVE